MKQKDKDLLLRDLCARLPYRVICKRYVNAYELVEIDKKRGLVYLLRDEQYVPYSIIYGDEIKPYLRPMSSMTENEKEEYNKVMLKSERYEEYYYTDIDWLYSHHFDIRNLIDKGLALEAPEGMYK